MLEITRKCDRFLTTKTPRPPAFTNCTHPDHRSQEGLFKGQNRLWLAVTSQPSMSDTVCVYVLFDKMDLRFPLGDL